MTDIITRFAPSPTGNLHLGGLRTALVNFIISKQESTSKFFLRIEDTDKERSNKIYTQNIIESLDWLSIKHDTKIQFQSQRIKRHKEVAELLLKNKYAFKCNCDEKKLEEKRDYIKKHKLKIKKICTTCKNDKKIQNLKSEYAIRIQIPTEGETIINDLVQGKVSTNNIELDDYIILRKDGSPTYMLSVVVDDNDLGINLIIRGDDHLNNTFRQKYIYEYMKWHIPNYAHISLIHGEDGSKLSKRHGAINIIDLKKKGYLPEAIINNLILLGWSPKNQQNEIISLQEIINKFDIKEISKSSSIFSFDKLNFFNNYYLRLEKNLNYFIDYCKKNDELNFYLNEDQNKMLRLFEIYKKDLNYYEEILKYTKVYFDENYEINQDHEKFDIIFENNFSIFLDGLSNLENWSKYEIEEFVKNFLKQKNIKFPIFAKPLRFILTNYYQGPSISDIFYILGKKNTLRRLNQYIKD
tara:strand:- start:2711 stop:4114 length:1404 start_codon:yes stop_codon:yes gene_type:complete